MINEAQAHPRRRRAALRWRPYAAARAYVRAQALPTATAYRTWTQRPADIPSDPRGVYAAAWTGWDDWLGRAPRRWRPFAAARAFMHTQGLRTAQEFCAWRRTAARPRDIPTAPQRVYAREWQGWRDWVRGSGSPTPQWRPFVQARALVQSQHLSSATSYARWCRTAARPADIPTAPYRVYREEWQGWRDWLAAGAPRPPRWRPFVAARAFVRAQGLRSAEDFYAWRRTPARPADIPTAPQRVYAGEWQGWRDWVHSPVVGAEARDEG